jgi:uncharacterized Zn finger protein (UPF0148 family)
MSDICIKCGKQYDEYSPKHGHICHDCYKAYLREYGKIHRIKRRTDDPVISRDNSLFKVCSLCGFRFLKSLPGSHRLHCPACNRKEIAKREEKNLEKHRANRRRYYDNHKDEAKARAKKWNEEHPERVKAAREKCRDIVRESRRKYFAIKRKTDPSWVIKRSLRSRLGMALNAQDGKKNAKTIEYLGCSIADFKNYLESLFSDGMNWSNHGNGIGKWNIDHIIPCNAFDLTNEEEQRECFHYKNMRPLWWEENVHKSDKLPDGTRARDIA